MIKAVLFDLDGTLTDSGPGIMHAAETALGSFGITGLSEQALRQFVGPPLVESFAVYLSQADVQTAIDRFRAYYRETGWLENEPYPGVRECLRALRAAGKRMYVATSKLESMARQVLTHFDLMQYFDGVCGGIADDPEAGKKANVVRRALREAGCTEFSRAILSGDREYDIYGGHAAGNPDRRRALRLRQPGGAGISRCGRACGNAGGAAGASAVIFPVKPLVNRRLV